MTPAFTSDCGRVTLYQGDCVEVMGSLGPVDVAIMDPPYEITMSGGPMAQARTAYTDSDGFTDCGFDYEILDRFDNWVCFGTLRQVPKLIERAGDLRWMLVTWNKTNPMPFVNGNYLPDTEYIIHAWSDGCLYGDARSKSRFIVHPNGDKHTSHPNEKPVRVMTKMIINASAKGQTILDPFMGSGTTGIACIRTGRRFIGIEKEPKYFHVALDRIKTELNQLTLAVL